MSKRAAETRILGYNGHRVDIGHSVTLNIHCRSPLGPEAQELYESAPSLEDVLRSAAQREAALSEYGISDSVVADELASASFVRSRMQLTAMGLLP